MRLTKKKTIIIFLIALTCLGFFLVYTKNNTLIERVTYMCADEKKLDVSIYENAIIAHFDEKKNIHFRKDLSNESASRFLSTDNTMILWKNDQFIMIEEGNSVPYYECNKTGPLTDPLANPSIEILSDKVQLAPPSN